MNIMKTFLRAAALIVVAALPAASQSTRADIEAVVQDYLFQHPEVVQRIVKDYMIKNPDVLREALAELVKGRRGIATGNGNQSIAAAIKTNAKLLFESRHQVTLGNPQGAITLVEFFDYNCGYCKRALSDMMALLKDDANLRIVLKELPVLGPGSTEAARVAAAAHMQDALGEKYLTFHQALLGGYGPANESTALAAAKAAGFDIERLRADMTSDEVNQALTESSNLARAIGINGTPGYVIGDTVVAGAVGLAALKERIWASRQAQN